jgi:hypothetical protein
MNQTKRVWILPYTSVPESVLHNCFDLQAMTRTLWERLANSCCLLGDALVSYQIQCHHADTFSTKPTSDPAEKANIRLPMGFEVGRRLLIT